MSSTRNSRNLLVNVFRPSYSYGSLTGFTPALSLSNIDTITAETVVTSNLNLGDASQNLFLGSNSGNLIGNNTGDTGIGYNAMGGISNVRNSVAVGKNAMTGVTDSSGVICIGVDTIGGGTQSIYIGSGTRASGANNILLGTDISLGSVSNRLVVGNILQGDQSNRSLDICTNQTIVWGKMGIQRIPQRSFEVLGDTYSTDGFVTGSGSVSRPAFRFELDNSTGLYWPGSNKFALAAGGVQRMVADTSTTIVGDLRVTGNFSAASGGGGGIVGGVIDVSGVTFSEYIRDSSTNPTKYDISGGNISNSGTTRSSNFITSNGTSNNIGGVILCNAGNTVTIGNGFITDISTTPYLRLGTTVNSFQVDMSGGNISNSATTTSSNFTTPTASTNTIGGVNLTNNILQASQIQDKLGGVFFDIQANGNVIYAGRISNVDVTQSNNIGGVTLSNSNVTSTNAIVSGYMRNSLTPNQFDISGGNISNSGTTTSSNFTTPTASTNTIGGVSLSGSNVSNVSTMSSTNAIVSGYLRNALTPSQFDISGGNISNSGTTTSTNFITTSGITNVIGEVSLVGGTVQANRIQDTFGGAFFDITPAGNIIYTGAISNVNSGQSNNIGGVTLCNTNIAYDGTITGNTDNTNNKIGGVTLSNRTVGIGTTTPAYALDVCGSAGSASMNLATWPRMSVSNVLNVRGVGTPSSIGNTIIFSNDIQNTIDPNLMTVDLFNTTSGNSFKILKSGIWSINAIVFNSTIGILHWIDVSTNNDSNVGFTTNGNPVIALSQTYGYSITLNFTGWLPGSADNFYKLRFNSGSISPSTFAYFQASLLCETPDSAGTFPY